MTDTIRVDLSELRKFLDQTEGAERVAEREATRTMQASLSAIEEQVVARTPVNTGALRGATATELFRGTGLNMRGMVLNPLVYGMPVEYGRKAGKMPPPAAIQYWVQRKGITFTDDQGKIISAEATAWLIARAIGARGTKGAFMFKRGFEAAEPHVLAAWDSLLSRIVKELAKGV
jgi:hypothetical protein